MGKLKIIIKTKSFDRLSKVELEKVRRLTLDKSRGSEMQEFMDEPEPNCKCVLAMHKQDIIAWALLKPSSYSVAVQVYVKAPYRRKGIGSAMVARARKVKSRVWPHKSLTGNYWSYQAQSFFRSVNLKHKD